MHINLRFNYVRYLTFRKLKIKFFKKKIYITKKHLDKMTRVSFKLITILGSISNLARNSVTILKENLLLI
jgi:hypothetical protein